MRLISQNRAIDIPYDGVCIVTDKNEIIAYGIQTCAEDAYWVMGEYGSEEGAQDVMKLLRNTRKDERYFYFPSSGYKDMDMGV